MKRSHPLYWLHKFRMNPRFTCSRVYDLSQTGSQEHPVTDDYSEDLRLAELKKFIKKNLKPIPGKD